MSEHAQQLPSSEPADDRSGMDGAWWMVAFLVIALLYGLSISALSGAADQATPDTVVPRPAPAIALHGEPVSDRTP